MSLPSLIANSAKCAIILSASVALGACNSEPEEGGLVLSYSFAPMTSCDMNEESIAELQVEVGENGVYATQTSTCENGGGEIQLAGVPIGTHDLFVYGIDEDNDAALDNRGGQTSDDRIEIIAGNTVTLPVTLGLAPARFEVGLIVNNNGFPAQCGSASIVVKGIRAEAWSFDDSEPLRSVEFDLCDFDGVQSVSDPDRDINGRRFDGAVFQPLDDQGLPVGSAINLPFNEPVGAGKLARIIVECEDDTCTAERVAAPAGVGGGDTTPDPTGGSNDPTGTNDPTEGDSTGA